MWNFMAKICFVTEIWVKMCLFMVNHNNLQEKYRQLWNTKLLKIKCLNRINWNLKLAPLMIFPMKQKTIYFEKSDRASLNYWCFKCLLSHNSSGSITRKSSRMCFTKLRHVVQTLVKNSLPITDQFAACTTC